MHEEGSSHGRLGCGRTCRDLVDIQQCAAVNVTSLREIWMYSQAAYRLSDADANAAADCCMAHAYLVLLDVPARSRSPRQGVGNEGIVTGGSKTEVVLGLC